VAAIREFVSEYGIPGGFVGAHPYGVDISMFKRDLSVRGKKSFDSEHFPLARFGFTREYYHHTEYEIKDIVGAEFSIFTYQANAELSTRNILFFDKGALGVSVEHRDFDIGGYVFTAPTRSLKYAAYLLQAWESDDFSYEAALRYTGAAFSPRKAQASARDEFIVPKTYQAISSSASVIYEFAPSWFAGGNVSWSSRVPSIEELYSEGPHLAAYSYEIGDPKLKLEQGLGAEAFLYRKTPELFFNVTCFWNELSSYVIARNTGRINYNTLLPVYQSTGVRARLAGFEAQAEYHAPMNLTLSVSLSYAFGTILAGNTPLPMIPPLKSRLEAKYDTGQLSLGTSVEAVAEQNRLAAFESATEGYIIANAFAQYSLPGGAFIHNISVNLENIFNTEYRNHLSRVKTVMPEAGRNIRAMYRMYF
jgi:iron complex outermembrane receptor protein